MKVQKLRTETLLQKNAKHRAPEGIRGLWTRKSNVTCMSDSTTCWRIYKWNYEGNRLQRSRLLLYSAPAWLCITITQQLVKQLWVTLPRTFRTHAVVYGFHFVHPRQFVHSTCLGARLWLNHDPQVIFDGHQDDVRTIWPLEHVWISSRTWSLFEAAFSFSFSCHGQSVRRIPFRLSRSYSRYF